MHGNSYRVDPVTLWLIQWKAEVNQLLNDLNITLLYSYVQCVTPYCVMNTCPNSVLGKHSHYLGLIIVRAYPKRVDALIINLIDIHSHIRRFDKEANNSLSNCL